jgi:hypothetical protein
MMIECAFDHWKIKENDVNSKYSTNMLQLTIVNIIGIVLSIIQYV